MKKYPLAVTFLALALSGCGGGSSGSSSTPAAGANASASNLSTAQKNYEGMALSANGGLHYLDDSLSFTSSSTGAITITPSSFFFTQNSSIAQSALNGTQPLTMTNSTAAQTLPLPVLAAARYMVNGTIYSLGMPAQAQISYKGNNVQEDYFATDGVTIIHSTLGTSYTVSNLSGLIASSPPELFDNSGLGVITNTINGNSLYNRQANWQTGAAYIKAVRQVVGDTLEVGDCIAPATTGPSITPCSSAIGTLEGFFPHTSATDGKTYQQTDGQIVTLAGVRAWVATAVLNTATTEYRVYYQNNGAIYSGVLTKDGTPLQIYALGTTTPQNFYISLNSAALQSIKSAVSF
ncbi:hypothetical protein [Glaciimonas soli]|uniref:hypothetical protein n=1 Tax=Glaciimonas soli TaxID=2590999 RepID=UPI002AD361B7|nr:hypothetical protein [Glaciimonas soli]